MLAAHDRDNIRFDLFAQLYDFNAVWKIAGVGVAYADHCGICSVNFICNNIVEFLRIDVPLDVAALIRQVLFFVIMAQRQNSCLAPV